MNKLDESVVKEIELAQVMGYRNETRAQDQKIDLVSLDRDDVALLYLPRDVGGPVGTKGWYFWVMRHSLDSLPNDKDQPTWMNPNPKQWSDLQSYPSFLSAHVAATTVALSLEARRRYVLGVLHGAVVATLVVTLLTYLRS
jgi:hypothetical protein